MKNCNQQKIIIICFRTTGEIIKNCEKLVSNQNLIRKNEIPGATILVSQTVFSLLVGRVITKTSEAVPLLGRNKLKT